jgi:hypothetical protein
VVCSGFAQREKLNHLKFCPEKSDLLDALSAASTLYSKTALKLSLEMATLPRAEYHAMRSEVEAARVKSENVRNALIHHQREHGC